MDDKITYVVCRDFFTRAPLFCIEGTIDNYDEICSMVSRLYGSYNPISRIGIVVAVYNYQNEKFKDQKLDYNYHPYKQKIDSELINPSEKNQVISFSEFKNKYGTIINLEYMIKNYKTELEILEKKYENEKLFFYKKD